MGTSGKVAVMGVAVFDCRPLRVMIGAGAGAGGSMSSIASPVSGAASSRFRALSCCGSSLTTSAPRTLLSSITCSPSWFSYDSFMPDRTSDTGRPVTSATERSSGVLTPTPFVCLLDAEEIEPLRLTPASAVACVGLEVELWRARAGIGLSDTGLNSLVAAKVACKGEEAKDGDPLLPAATLKPRLAYNENFRQPYRTVCGLREQMVRLWFSCENSLRQDSLSDYFRDQIP